MSRLRGAWPVIALGAILALFLVYLGWLQPAEAFGRYHDDTIYFSSAQAVAQGKGHVLPSVPGEPAQTKYPILYSWLLSWIWRWGPAFPANLSWAVGLSAAAACWYLVASWWMLRRSLGLSEKAAVTITALTAFQPHFLGLSGAVMSDVPFMALAMTAMLAADARAMATAGVVAGLAVFTRSAGVAVIAGIAAMACYRRAWRQAALFCGVAAPFALVGLVRGAAGTAAAAAAAGEPGWSSTWLYYTSYLGYWKLAWEQPQVIRTLLGASLKGLLETPATYCLFPPLGGGESPWGGALAVTLTAGILAGICRQGQRHGWRAAHFVLPFYAAMHLLWAWPQMDRFLLLFLPLFYAGTWTEGRQLAARAAEVLRSGKPVLEKAAAGGIAAALLVVAALAAGHYWGGFRPQLRALSVARAGLSTEKQQAYGWIRERTRPQDRIIAYEDVVLYLHTGRQAMRPMVFSPATCFKPQQLLEPQLTHLGDVALRIGARYWVVSQDDYYWEACRPRICEKIAELNQGRPVVFRSQGGRVRVVEMTP